MVKCKLCELDKPKRMVMKRLPLEDISDKLTSQQRQHLRMFQCKNRIRVHKHDKYFDSICNNNLIRNIKKI